MCEASGAESCQSRVVDVGFFGTYLYHDAIWTSHRPDVMPGVSPPWLVVDIHDSDVTTVTYQPAGPGTGVAYLGYTPRTYFERDDASAPTDVQREASGLALWWAELHPEADGADR